MSPRFKDMYPYPVVAQHAAEVKATIEALKKDGVDFPEWDAPADTLVGIEIEIEKIVDQINSNFWQVVPEGSLRSGYEAKTYALKGPAVPFAMYVLDNFLQTHEHLFSPMTSVHVHVDFRENTPNEIVKLLLVYIAFERFLFGFAGPERYKSNYCVPITDMNFSRSMWKLLDWMGPDGEAVMGHGDFQLTLSKMLPSKYTAFNTINLFPRRDRKAGLEKGHGTIEFRHMVGTADPMVVITWVKLLLMLKDYAVNTKFSEIKQQILSLNTTSHYQQFAEQVFGKHWMVIMPMSMSWELLASNIQLLKSCFAGDYNVSPNFPETPLGKRLAVKEPAAKPDWKKQLLKFAGNPQPVQVVIDDAIPDQERNA